MQRAAKKSTRQKQADGGAAGAAALARRTGLAGFCWAVKATEDASVGCVRALSSDDSWEQEMRSGRAVGSGVERARPSLTACGKAPCGEESSGAKAAQRAPEEKSCSCAFYSSCQSLPALLFHGQGASMMAARPALPRAGRRLGRCQMRIAQRSWLSISCALNDITRSTSTNWPCGVRMALIETVAGVDSRQRRRLLFAGIARPS